MAEAPGEPRRPQHAHVPSCSTATALPQPHLPRATAGLRAMQRAAGELADRASLVVPSPVRRRGFHVATSTATRKARDLAADPQVTVIVDDRSTIEWASAVGTAELLTARGPERSTTGCTGCG